MRAEVMLEGWDEDEYMPSNEQEKALDLMGSTLMGHAASGCVVELIRHFSGSQVGFGWTLHTATFRGVFGDKFDDGNTPEDKDRYDLTLTQRTTAVITAIPDQVDFIAADGNLFAQRNLKNSSHSDYLTSTLVEKVDAAVTYWNVMPQHYNNHVTYQVVSSTAAEGWLKAQKGEDYDADCILLVSLCYGKQTVIQSERRLKGQKMTATEKGSPIVREDEYIINDQERPKHLIRQDLGLTLTDKDWHNPLLCTIRLRPLKNNRQRSGATAERRKSEARNYFQYIGQKEDTTQHRQRYTQGQLPPDNGM
ncbi:unnamed protein product [Cladocopium goreaui]|uniref:Uncharacterized protein n=1 Tax=Cladocopium goreaui TaxID=2562237 RepID=A0A9P1G1Z9_9DINO|nr:unnamed protein product [Cladocopium goreaui]